MGYLFTDELTADEAIMIIKHHAENWHNKAQEEAKNEKFNSAQSYKDMAYAAEALIGEINRSQIEKYKSVDGNLASAI